MASNGRKGKESNVPKPPQKSRAKVRGPNEKKDAGRQLTNDDWDDILDWLEMNGNWQKIEGTDNVPNVGSRPCTKMQGYREMVSYLNSRPRNQDAEPFKGDSMKARWPYFMKKFKACKKESMQTGFGIDPSVDGADVRMIEAKLTKKFWHYTRMDALFGTLPSILEQTREVTTHGIFPDDTTVDISSDDVPPIWGDVDQASVTQGGDAVSSTTDFESQPGLHSDNPDDYNMGSVAAPCGPQPPGNGEEDGRHSGQGSPSTLVTPTPIPNGMPTPGPQPETVTPTQNVTQAQIGPATLNAATPPAKGTPTPGAGNPQKRKSASSPIEGGIKDQGNTYPKPKQIGETRHAINSAFAMSLGDMTAVREKANDVSKERFKADETLKREQFDEQKCVQILKDKADAQDREWKKKKEEAGRKERRLERLEKAKDREEKSKADYRQIMVSLVAATGGQMDKLEEMEKVFGDFKR